MPETHPAMMPRHIVRKWRRALKKSLTTSIMDNLPVSEAPNCSYSKQTILLTLIESIARNEYPSPYTQAARMQGRKIPDGDTLYYRLKELTLDQVFKTAQKALGHIHAEAKKIGALDRPLPAAMDLTEEPVFGKPDSSTIGSAKTNGTKFAHQMLTIQAVQGEHLLPLAIHKRTQIDQIPAVAAQALSDAMSIVPIDPILADRAFWSVKSIRTFKQSGSAFVVPAPENGRMKEEIRKARPKSQQQGTRPEYVYIDPNFQLGDGPDSVRFAVVYIFRPEEARIRPDGSKKPEHFVFGTSWPVTHEKALTLADLYDHRWVIEVGYRDSDELEGKTRSENPVIQWLFFLLSMLLYAIWTFGRISWVPRKKLVRFELTKFWVRHILSNCTRWRMRHI